METDEAGKALLSMLLTHATSPSFTYVHAWEVGDVLVWDNTQVLHRPFPYDNDGAARRELYRTQARLRPELCKRAGAHQPGGGGGAAALREEL